LPLVEDVCTLLFVAGSVSEGDRSESPAFIEIPGRLVALKSVQANGRREFAPRELQQPGANAAPHPSRKQVKLIDPAAIGTFRHSQEPDYQTIDDGNRGLSRGNQMPADPLANGFIGVDQRRTRHKFLTRAEIDIRHGIGVTQRGRPKFEAHLSYDALRGDLASPGAVEDHPHGEVLAEVLETMLGPCGHEQKIARLERVPLAVVKQDAPAADDDVDLVLRMRRLLVRGRREGELHV